ncbi:MAG: hypothetical protein IMZ58_08465 [Thermoplasmata archaeon]|nr:hypothetical protein [Thermoplasmata archaeon]
MRYTVKFIGKGIYAVIDNEAPKAIRGKQKYGHVLLSSRNGSQVCYIAAKALNNRIEGQPSLSDGEWKTMCCKLKIGSEFTHCPKCGTFLW